MIEVTAEPPTGRQKGDTTEINASAFKTLPDAIAGDLIKKMPGIQTDTKGSVKAHGEDVTKVLVDGKPFFSDNPSIVLNTLPAEIISRIQIFDKKSDKTEFTGIDDGQKIKTINIITKNKLNSGETADFKSNYGYPEKYSFNMNFNRFDSTSKFTILGNINDDIMKMPGRAELSGLNKSRAAGINYTDKWETGLETNGSYNINYSKSDNYRDLSRQYLSADNPASYFTQNNRSLSENINHSTNMRLEYKIDSSNAILFIPNFSLQNNNTNSTNTGLNLKKDSTQLNSTSQNNNSAGSVFNYSGEMFYRHKFDTSGRLFSIDLTTKFNNNNSSGNNNIIQTDSIKNNNLIEQKKEIKNSGYNLGGSLNYIEPINDKSKLKFSYTINIYSNLSDNMIFKPDTVSNNFNLTDSLLSAKYENNVLYHKASVGYSYKLKGMEINAVINFQSSILKNDKEFPKSEYLEYKFNSFLPFVRLNYKFTNNSNLQMYYNTNSNAPSFYQLSNIIDNKNPLQLYIGNPSLKPSYSHNIYSQYSLYDTASNSMFYSVLSISIRLNNTGNSTTIFRKDTLFQNNYFIPSGGQLTSPVNLDGYLTGRLIFNYNFPIDFISSKLNLNIGGGYTRNPSLINSEMNYSNIYNASGTITLSSNISKDIDFTVSSTANFYKTINTIQQKSGLNNNDFQNQIRLKWLIWQGFFIQFDYSNQILANLAQQNNNLNLLNLSFGKKLFANNSGELKLSAYDIFNHNTNIQTNITDYYSEVVRSSIPTRFISLEFIYNFRNFH